MQIGVMIPVRKDTNMLAELQKVKDLDLQSCQISIWNPDFYTDELAAEINAAVEATETDVTETTEATKNAVTETVEASEEVAE